MSEPNAPVPRRDVTKSGNWFRDYDSIPASSEPDELTLMLCPRTISAFSLRKKRWSSYDVVDLGPVQFAADSWKRLVLKTEYKEVIWAMVKSYLGHNMGFHDLVAGKGEGLVILLHGPPGVGKTLTAECVAESFKKPLYMVTAGDLGTNPDTLEAKLSTIFDHAVAWDALLLLDEADIFLQDRDYDNLHRNALVFIFLRTLEYFNGIMFLTSNRVAAFDQAFQSRIHITIGMPEFDETLRRGVWKIFIQDLGREHRDGSPPLLSREECKALGTEVTKSWASQPLNGRQIRNCVRSALALAENEGVSPNASHFNKVINLGNAFTKYMTQLQKAEAEEIAQIKGDRLAAMKDIMARESDL
ncbi:P-loop containing nucleoside triphosphate hydrolase protein [Colletotrichum acutatum]|uniref:P-loop containing nucleoside triphosphate hydrolase protein n=1 Tax=Glomerella acutata TaxID=27357 RepID=A0AAD8UMT8_GLOAC|nr:P-loop containing nucleoside triphosphate hydrolase protein [Colletotrichum acutatum]KAK1723969.1 P-loop containing nucleoside triphosphate hydrolase protein [Colletotrichum acutatum]